MRVKKGVDRPIISLYSSISPNGENTLGSEMYEDEVLQQGEQAIRNCLDRVPFLKIRDFQIEPDFSGRRPDFVVRVETIGGEYNLVVEAKSSGQPRVARRAIDQLRVYSEGVPNPYPVLLAPYVADATAQLCARDGVGYIDLAGNCRLSFGQVYIEQCGKENPFSEKRELRSLYSPKAERILRVLLTSPREVWKVQELASEADVSLGMASKVKQILKLKEWLAPRSRGVRLLDPEAALTEWAGEYRYSKHRAVDFYSLVSGSELEQQVVSAAKASDIRIALTGFSAAVRYAPAVRYRRSMIYCAGETAAIAQKLDLKQVSSGANLTLIQPYDEGVFYGVEPRDGLPVVSAIQTYLDLIKQSARGEEAAAALLQEVIHPSW
jgi:hypothetical protein